ncbi:hypothetical protein J5N97_029804 [Dioscorea zingiberensis]|uniref:C2H2-type domain-containing protein n=1 Tax=Dioscorea zingiberensis TaxID=325984 RepID=A0A9D5BWS8_9LILI|nr:hypothetical protein J5N97_029804 [Dioscorea zingiberensis]
MLPPLRQWSGAQRPHEIPHSSRISAVAVVFVVGGRVGSGWARVWLAGEPREELLACGSEVRRRSVVFVVVQDRESETESRSPPRVIMVTDQRLRSKRPRRAEPEPASSVSDTTTEEDVALSLMMLSRDSWSRSDASDSSDGDEEDEPASAPVRSSPRSRFQCGTCKKVFRSYQALGGHRASHKKESKDSAKQSKASIPNSQIHEAESSDANADRIHECPVCFRVFSSGQALGGHKRSHLTNTITTSLLRQPPPPTPKLIDSFIDLNLPAPIDDDVELSAVSDPDFSRRPPT